MALTFTQWQAAKDGKRVAIEAAQAALDAVNERWMAARAEAEKQVAAVDLLFADERNAAIAAVTSLKAELSELVGSI